MDIEPTKDWNYKLVKYFLGNTQLAVMLLLFIPDLSNSDFTI